MSSKVVVVMPAYNAAKTLVRTVQAIPPGVVDEIILVDDASQDNTVEIARSIGLHILVHDVNRGYGGNQKTCYTEALARGAEIVVMLHPDFQYDPGRVGEMVRPIKEGKADVVFGSRFLGQHLRNMDMPLWRNIGNIALTAIENWVFETTLSEFHTGYKAYHRRVLEAIPFRLNSDDFVFDQEINAQIIAFGFRVVEIPVMTRYFDDASSISFTRSIVYGLKTLHTIILFLSHKHGLWRHPMFMPCVSPNTVLPRFG